MIDEILAHADHEFCAGACRICDGLIDPAKGRIADDGKQHDSKKHKADSFAVHFFASFVCPGLATPAGHCLLSDRQTHIFATNA
jgi:hypothetical protein